jgi:hypothetical protein
LHRYSALCVSEDEGPEGILRRTIHPSSGCIYSKLIADYGSWFYRHAIAGQNDRELLLDSQWSVRIEDDNRNSQARRELPNERTSAHGILSALVLTRRQFTITVPTMSFELTRSFDHSHLKTARLPVSPRRLKVEVRGIEPLLVPCEGTVLPLSLHPHLLCWQHSNQQRFAGNATL